VTEHVVSLDDPVCRQNEMTGGKGASLGRMRAAGMTVPPGFVVTAAAFEDSLADRGVLDQLRDLAGSEEGDVTEIRDLVLGTPLSELLRDQISTAYADLGPEAFVAVRSSACAEDGEVASFAGQQETYLNVRGIDQVLGKVVECWASFFSERAMFYRQRKGSLADLGMAVVIQEQIGSEKSGVMFTTDPIRGRSDQMVIEAAFGLGEALVSGLVTPDNYVARRDGRLKKAHIGNQDQMIVRDATGGTVTHALDPDLASTQVLDEEEIARLVEIGLRLEAEFGSPQDVEWAIAGEELYVLQSRPITTRSGA
jgi:pyruvate,water dikinase